MARVGSRTYQREETLTFCKLQRVASVSGSPVNVGKCYSENKKFCRGLLTILLGDRLKNTIFAFPMRMLSAKV